MSKDRRDDLYCLATLLAEIDRVLHPLDRAGLGGARIQPSIPPPLPPTGAAGGAVGGGRSSAEPGRLTRGNASGAYPRQSAARHDGRDPASPGVDRRRSADRPWIEPPPVEDRVDRPQASEAPTSGWQAPPEKEPPARASELPGETKDGLPAQTRAHPSRPDRETSAPETVPTATDGRPDSPRRTRQRSDRSAEDAPHSQMRGQDNPAEGTRVAAPGRDVAARGRDVDRAGFETPPASSRRPPPTITETRDRHDRVAGPPTPHRPQKRGGPDTSAAASSGDTHAEQPHRPETPPGRVSSDRSRPPEPDLPSAEAPLSRARPEPNAPAAIRVPPPARPDAATPNLPRSRTPTLPDAPQGERLTAFEGRPPVSGEVPAGSGQIDITIDPSDLAGPSRSTIAATSPPDLDVAEEEEDNESEVWVADDAEPVDWRGFTLRGRTIGSLRAAALARVDRRIKVRFLDRTLRRLT